MPTNTAQLDNKELISSEQEYSGNPLEDRETDQYRNEYVMSFAEKWDELIDWDGRAQSEGQFFVDILRAKGKESVLDVAAGTGFHSVSLTEAGFNVTMADGSAAMIAKAFENGQKRGLILKTAQADWRWLNRDINGKYDAIICLGNSFTHLHEEQDRRKALAEFYAALKHDGILIIDQRNYDSILDHGFSSKHKYYYCGDQVTAEPEHVDEGLARFKYSFPDGSEYTLNMFPLRKNYLRNLLNEAGFNRVHTYGDFQETYKDQNPDFFVHVAEKQVLESGRWGANNSGADKDIRDVTEDYYDSGDADTFYFKVWGGEDIHVGIYDETSDIKTASVKTIEKMIETVGGLKGHERVLDIGAGYGGSGRYMAREYGVDVQCLNISETQNDTNRYLNRQQGLTDKVGVKHGVFEDIPEADSSFDMVWCQDSILHSDERAKVLAEVYRVLKPGGVFVFTDPMQADDCPPDVLQPVYDRLQLNSLGSMRFYREAANATGFEVLDQIEMTHQLRTHYNTVRENLLANYDELRESASREYLDKMIVGLENWVNAADSGYLCWGIQRFQKPA